MPDWADDEQLDEASMSVAKRQPLADDPKVQVHGKFGVQEVPAKVAKPRHLEDQLREFVDSDLESHPDENKLRYPDFGTLPGQFNELC